MTDVFDIAELEGSYTERAVVNEATKKDTVYKGNYPVKVVKASLQVAPSDSQTPGRRVVNLQVAVPKGDKQITQFVRISPDVHRKLSIAGEVILVAPTHSDYDASLPLDSQSKLWGHVESVINPTGKLTKADVVRELPGSTMDAYILEGFMFEGGKIEFPSADPRKDLKAYEAERAALIQHGGISKNFISSFKAVK